MDNDDDDFMIYPLTYGHFSGIVNGRMEELRSFFYAQNYVPERQMLTTII